MFEQFPYADMQQLNLDWIIKIAKDFLDQYTHIQQLINDGETDITNLTADSLEELENKKTAIVQLLDAWYAEHQEDISTDLANALETLSTALNTALSDFSTGAAERAAAAIASIPSDYTALYNQVNNDGVLALNAYGSYAALPVNYRNADNLPVNRIIGYKFGMTTEQQATMTNFPVMPFSGEIMTINTTKAHDAFGFQLAISEAAYSSGIGNKLFFRSRFQAWTSWVEVTNNENIEALLTGNTLFINDAYISYSRLPESYRNADNLPINRIIGYKFGMSAEQQATMSNFPIMPFSGEIMTINTTKAHDSFGFQLAISEAAYTSAFGNRVFFRTRFQSWTSWVEITNPVYQNNAFKGLGSFVACGDSLTVSYSFINTTDYITVKSWAQYLADEMGTTAVIKAQGGITSGGFLASALMTQAEADNSDFAIVYLGTNDANQQVDQTTFASNYTNIVNRLLTNHKVVFCIPLAPATSVSTRDAYNETIKTVAESITGAFYVDMSTVNNQFDRFVRSGHLNSLGYAAFANAVAQALNIVISVNPLMIV